MRFTLTAEMDHEVTGELGWLDTRVPRGSETYGPLTGSGIAHDLLEHFAFEHVGDEIEAHGVIFRIRYESGWVSRGIFSRPLSLDALASEWIQLVQAMNEGHLPVPRSTRPLDASVESEIDAIIEKGRKIVHDEFAYDGVMDENDADNLEILSDRFRAYFRIGYRKACRKYKDAYNAGYCYNMLAERMEKMKPDFEGQKMTVDVNLRTCEVKINTTDY